MKQRYMLDTNICSYVIKGQNQHLMELIEKNRTQLCISSITMAELLFGAAKKNSQRLTESVQLFLELAEIKQWSPEAAIVYAQIRKNLENAGTPIGSMDILIASSAIAEKAILITNNTAHFSKIPNLHIENWMK